MKTFTDNVNSSQGLAGQPSDNKNETGPPSSSSSSKASAKKTSANTATLFAPRDFVYHHQVKDERSVMDSYTLGSRVGYGGYGSIYACMHKMTGVERAMKVVTKQHYYLTNQPPTPVAAATPTPTNISSNSNTKTPPLLPTPPPETHEFLTAQHLDHPNLARVYECFEDAQNVYIIMDLYKGGDLLYALTNKIGCCLNESNAALLMNTLLTAIHYCHTQQHTAHLDLKLENLMFPNHGDENDGVDNHNNTSLPSYLMRDAKIIDFGLSRPIEYDMDSQGNQTVRQMTEVVGSTAYMAPQVFQACYNPQKQDIWSIGVLAFMVLAGRPPFEGRNDFDIMTKILQYDETKLFLDDDDDAAAAAAEMWSTISKDAKDFIASLMAYEEGKRPTAEEALEHPWLQRARQKADDVVNASLSLLREEETAKDPQYVSGMRTVFAHLLRDNHNHGSSHDESTPLLWKDATRALLVSQYGVTGTQQVMLDDCFRAMDTSHQGVLSKADLLAGIQRFYLMGADTCGDDDQKPVKEEDYDIEGVVNALMEQRFPSAEGAEDNSDESDPVLTYADFVAAASSNSLFQDDDRLHYAFRVFSQGSDYITRYNLTVALGSDRPNVDSVVDTMMRQIDADTPGLISFAEFKTAVTQQALPLTTLKESTSLAAWEELLSDTVMDTCTKSCFALVEQYMRIDESPSPDLKRTPSCDRDTVEVAAKRPRRSDSPRNISVDSPVTQDLVYSSDSATVDSGSTECESLLGSYPREALLPLEEYETCHDEN